MAERYINAAKDGFIDPLREATRKDLNTPDEDGMTATTWAAHNGNLEALRLIVGREGDVNRADNYGMTSLHHAALRGHLDVVSYLINWGCNIYALDNDNQSALDLAAQNERTGIVRFIDGELAQKEKKNPRQAARMKEEALRVAESNRKKFEKMVEVASKKAEREHRKYQQSNNPDSEKPKKSLFKTLAGTLRLRGSESSLPKIGQSSSNYSDMAGLSYRNPRGVSKKIQIKKFSNGSMNPKSTFKVRDFDGTGNQTVRSLGASQGYFGSMSEVMYLKGLDSGSASPEGIDALGGSRRPVYDVFDKNTNSRAKPTTKSESDLLDPSLYEDDEDDQGGIFNRPRFGQLAFFTKRPFVDSLSSFDHAGTSNGGTREDEGSIDSHGSSHTGSDPKNNSFPWDQDDLDELDDDDNNGIQKEFSAVETFLWASGLAGYLHIFSQEEIDFKLLLNMSDADLKELGLPFGPRKKLEDAIKRRKDIVASPKIMSDSFL